MKTIQISLMWMVMLCSYITVAQNKDKQRSAAPEQLSNVNFMDLQSKVMTDLFGSNLSGNPDGQSIGFLELLEKMELTPEQKLECKNLYYLQAKALTQKQKDSFARILENKISEAQLEKQ